MDKSIEYLDQILKTIYEHNTIRVRYLFEEIETSEEKKRKGWALVDNPNSQFFNAIHYLEEDGYILSYNLDTSGDRSMRLHYKAILLLKKGGFTGKNKRDVEQLWMERFFKYGMPLATIAAVLVSLFGEN